MYERTLSQGNASVAQRIRVHGFEPWGRGFESLRGRQDFMLIVFEGGEGSGKGTQIKLLKTFLRRKGYKVIDIVEPGGTPAGKAIRNLLLKKQNLDLLGITEAFLFSASRAQQVRTITKPALEQGKIVLSDRSFFSTYAYQGYGREQNLDLLQKLTDIAVAEIIPDLVILLDIDPEVGVNRKKAQNEITRIDLEKLEFHQKVRDGYHKLASQNPRLWKTVDASMPIKAIHNEICQYVTTALNNAL